MTRMTTGREARREQVERALFGLGLAVVLLDDQVRLRVQQAVRRDAELGRLLNPALGELERVEGAMRAAMDVLGQQWQDHEGAGWRGDSE